MQKLFEYNWQVRKEWFDWCETVSMEELMRKRTGHLNKTASIPLECGCLLFS